MELRAFADWTLRRACSLVPGVARVNVFGGEVPSAPDPARRRRGSRARGLALADVLAAARAATAMRRRRLRRHAEPAHRRRRARRRAERRGARARRGRASADGAPLRLGDVAGVAEGAAPRFGDALIQGRAGVLLTLSAAYGANTLEVTRALESALARAEPALGAEVIGSTRASTGRRASSSRRSATSAAPLLLGGVLVAAVLVRFPRRARARRSSRSRRSRSRCCRRSIVLYRLGVTLNTMSLGGLAIAIGEVVDDAIIDVENIAAPAARERAAGEPRQRLAVVLEASLEVRGAVVFATLRRGARLPAAAALRGSAAGASSRRSRSPTCSRSSRRSPSRSP